MYAIVEIAGQQFKVEKNQKLFVHRLNEKEGSKVLFDNVLLLDDGKKIDIGTPIINSASVEAKVINHLKGDKLIVFKKKRRKGYKTKNGHRQFLTELLIEKINEKKTTKAGTKKTVEKADIDSEKKSVKSKTKAKKLVTAKKVNDSEEIKSLLVKQIVSRVRWRESVLYMIQNGVNEFIEIGPGKVLSGLVKRISDKVSSKSINTIEEIKNLK